MAVLHATGSATPGTVSSYAEGSGMQRRTASDWHSASSLFHACAYTLGAHAFICAHCSSMYAVQALAVVLPPVPLLLDELPPLPLDDDGELPPLELDVLPIPELE